MLVIEQHQNAGVGNAALPSALQHLIFGPEGGGGDSIHLYRVFLKSLPSFRYIAY
jgi:hypothetical protein